MAGEGYHVDLEQLRTHTRRVQGLQANVQLAVDAARQVTPGGWDNAYGLICQFFPEILRPIANRAIDTTSRVAQVFGETEHNLTRTLRTYEDTEHTLADHFHEIQEKLDALSSSFGIRASVAPASTGGSGGEANGQR